MSQTRFQSRVGFFVVVCLVLVAALLLAFSKGTSLFTRTYEIKKRIGNVGGLKERSAVLLAGVQVGSLKSVELAPDGTRVWLHLQIVQKYSIRTNAAFVVEQLGVLGDQFVSIYPATNAAPLLRDGDEVQGKEPFNLQEAARSAVQALNRINNVSEDIGLLVRDLREAVTNAKNTVLYTNIDRTITNFREVSERTLSTVKQLESVVQTNCQPFAEGISNMVAFSARLRTVADDLDQTILTNRASLQASVTNFHQATTSLKNIGADLDDGKGLAGALLKDPQLPVHVSQTLSNLAVLTSNLNRYGLLYKPRAPQPPPTTKFPHEKQQF